MSPKKSYVRWNPWHGCTKISAGCRYCYVYRQDNMYGRTEASSLCRKTMNFDLPIRKTRNKNYKIPPNIEIWTCFTSDFFLQDADDWRNECWQMMRQRSDCTFYFFTKRINRFYECIPDDWGNGYDNVRIGCTIENQAMADYRLPIFLSLPIKHKSIIASPLLEAISLTDYLEPQIEEVSVGGESGTNARVCQYDWILDIRNQCIAKSVNFRFHQTGRYFVKDGKCYDIPRIIQRPQAQKAAIDISFDTSPSQPSLLFE